MSLINRGETDATVAGQAGEDASGLASRCLEYSWAVGLLLLEAQTVLSLGGVVSGISKEADPHFL